MKLRKGDSVIVISGNDKGKVGKITAVQGDRLVVQGVNKRKKHQKAQDKKGGSIIEFEAPIHVSNVQLSVDGKPVKVKTRLNADGKKELYYLGKSNQETTLRVVK